MSAKISLSTFKDSPYIQIGDSDMLDILLDFLVKGLNCYDATFSFSQQHIIVTKNGILFFIDTPFH